MNPFSWVSLVRQEAKNSQSYLSILPTDLINSGIVLYLRCHSSTPGICRSQPQFVRSILYPPSSHRPEGIDLDAEGRILMTDYHHHEVTLWSETTRLMSVNILAPWLAQFTHRHQEDLISICGITERNYTFHGWNGERFSTFALQVEPMERTVADRKREQGGFWSIAWGTSRLRHYRASMEDPRIDQVIDLGTSIRCHHLIVLADGTIIILALNEVIILNEEGKRICSFPISYMHNCQYIAVDAEKKIFLADTWNHTILVYKIDGTFLGSFGKEGYTDGHFKSVSGIAISADGSIYISDSTLSRVSIFK